jgi:hypothetical protein
MIFKPLQRQWITSPAHDAWLAGVAFLVAGAGGIPGGSTLVRADTAAAGSPAK